MASNNLFDPFDMKIDQNIPTNKILVDGISVNEPENEIRKYFEAFGSVSGLTVIREPVSSYAFVTFLSIVAVESVSLITEHKINGTTINIQKIQEIPISSTSGLYLF